jgi:hypothetical protein
MMRYLRFSTCLAVAGLLSQPALAGDGVLEINQTCAANTGCFTGDAMGFPVTIANEGSYLLTSDLTAGSNEIGIQITSSNVTVDLNGFSVVSSSSDNHAVDGIDGNDVENVEIRNGTVRGFFGRGVQLAGTSRGGRVIDVRTLGSDWQGVDLDGGGHLVSRCTSVSNNLWGFSVEGDSMIIDSVAENNSSVGLALDSNTGYRGNMVGNNNGGNANAQISGGVDLGGNLCGGDATCP